MNPNRPSVETPSYSRTALEFCDKRELDAALTTSEAAKYYGKSARTIRNWCLENQLGCRLSGGPYKISRPLLNLFVAGKRKALEHYFNGKPLTEAAIAAFDQCGLLAALLECEAERKRLAERKAARSAMAAASASAT